MLLIFKGMTPNGAAVGLSKRYPTKHPGRVIVPRASGATKLSRCKEGMARVFAIRVQGFLSFTSIAVQAMWLQRSCQGVTNVTKVQWRSDRGTGFNGAGHLSR